MNEAKDRSELGYDLHAGEYIHVEHQLRKMDHGSWRFWFPGTFLVRN